MRKVLLVNGYHQERILIVLIYTFRVRLVLDLFNLFYIDGIRIAMALVTYILLSALHSGLSARFNPTIFGASASRALGVVLMDFLFVKMGCYFLGIQQMAGGGAADLVAYGGYKFVG